MILDALPPPILPYRTNLFPSAIPSSQRFLSSHKISIRSHTVFCAHNAQYLLDKMPNRPSKVSSWPSLILDSTKGGCFSQAFSIFSEMLKSDDKPDEFVLGSLLKASSGLSDLCIGEQLHAKAIRLGLASERGVRTSLIAMYSNCGFLKLARQVFDDVPFVHVTDVPTWNCLISVYVSHGQYDICFCVFSYMLSMGHLAPTDATYASIISACASAGEIEIGRMTHAMIVKDKTIDKTMLLNSLITMYSKCGDLDSANKVFQRVEKTNIVSWNAMIAGFGQNEEFNLALKSFRELTRFDQQVPVKPNRITFLSVLSSVSGCTALKLGREVHAQVIKTGLEIDTSIGNALVTMYGKCSDVIKCRLVFDRLLFRNVITWNSMLFGYAQNNQLENCIELFKEMIALGIKPDNHTVTILLNTLSSVTPISDCSMLIREIHGYLLRRSRSGLLNIAAYNAIITMYAKCEMLHEAEKLFNWMSKHDSYSWNAMIDGYSSNGYYDEAIAFFVYMQEQGLKCDHLTFSILLTACGRLASAELGKQIHAFTLKHHFPRCQHQSRLLSVNNALVAMYSKCGSISDSTKAFHHMAKKDVFSWTGMITAYAHHSMVYESFECFERMKRNGIEPNSVTFLGLLTACAHAGLVKEGTQYFNSMIEIYDVNPNVEHYACMVDLYGRSGDFERAVKMIETGILQLDLRQNSCVPLLKALLGACHAHNQLELGVQVARLILELDPEDETSHVLLSNLYASVGMWENAITVRNMMKAKGLKKEAGCSWVELENRRHVFVAGDCSHPDRKRIYDKLAELDEKCRLIGYIPMTNFVLHDVDEVQKEAILSSHSEKLAVSFSVLQNGRRKGAIRVIKNLRVCGDCHNWMKFASKVEGREIVLRDSRRFHFFEDGKCSCGDYW
ncbi:pentatricopeptide repeat-containing protein At3g24000, mitochondrial-like [Dioscorea cayenensis subsp. rotundata]|uniref:Pentatricopeptide repeat-containing protein At3g24000, mitochondrial-like n=1 Tax=Dioscorea cayennensis subsp. rotundata TaxID=55577 RepID=A0AB40D139_DIOCR|nr:pentatricopeptide repeat-containing protein At3g24000, mitochondrial-like [Dioscorea cayenensis subsp. rotundata]